MPAVADAARRRVTLGRVGAPHGVRGWIRVVSYTEPAANLLQYPVWELSWGSEWRRYRVLEAQPHGSAFIAWLAPDDDGGDPLCDRDAAERLKGAEIAVRRDQLSAPAPGEYYWVDLEGLQVETVEGVDLGTVTRIFETGANDVLVIRGERERLVPFLRDQVVREVDLDAGVIRVDWDPEF